MDDNTRIAKRTEVMERKIGEEFEFLGYTLIVSESTFTCKGCFFYEHNIACDNKEIIGITGDCRLGNRDIIFKEVKD